MGGGNVRRFGVKVLVAYCYYTSFIHQQSQTISTYQYVYNPPGLFQYVAVSIKYYIIIYIILIKIGIIVGDLCC